MHDRVEYAKYSLPSDREIATWSANQIEITRDDNVENLITEKILRYAQFYLDSCHQRLH